MTEDDLIRAVRRSFIVDASHRRAVRRRIVADVRDAERRREVAAEHRRNSAQLRKLYRSKAFLNLARSFSVIYRDFVVAGTDELSAVDDAILTEIAVRDLCSLIKWLTKLRPLVCDTPPLQLLARADEQKQLRRNQIDELRKIAMTATEKHASMLNTVAQEMEQLEKNLARQDDYDFNFYGLVDLKYVGRRGSAATNAEGAWRGLLIRQLRSRLPEDLELITHPYSTIAKLLTWAGIDGLTPQLVRSTLMGGHT